MPDEFKAALGKLLQCNLTWEESNALFTKYDRDGSGDIDIYEFIEGIMKPFGSPATLSGDIRDVAQAGEFKSGYTDYVPPSPAPPRVAKAQFGINKMLNAKTPPREDPDFNPSSTNQHPHAWTLRAKTPNGSTLSEFSTRGVVDDAERERLARLPELMSFAYQIGTTQAYRKKRQPKDEYGNPIEVSATNPWRPFKNPLEASDLQAISLPACDMCDHEYIY